MEFKTKPYKHQLEALERSWNKDEFALLMEAGTGKSKIIVDTAARLRQDGKIDTLLVVAPNGVHREWLDQFRTHMPDDVKYIAWYYQSGASREHRANMDKVVGCSDKLLRVVTVNVEAISIKSGMDFVLPLLRRKKVMTVIDESHTIKTPSSKRTRNAYKLGSGSYYRRILTGTPIANGYQDAYSQFRFLNSRIIGCQTFTEFKSTYCILGGFENRQIISYRNIEDLQRRIAPYSFEANKKDCLDLPEQIFMPTREVPLTAEQIRVYKQLRDDFVSEIESGKVLEVPLAMTRMMRLQQVISGYAPDPSTLHLPGPDQHWIPIPCHRADAALGIVQEALRGKVLVWCHFHHDVKALAQKLEDAGIEFVTYYGPDSPEQRKANLDRFRSDPLCKVFLATRSTGGTGLTINEADTVIDYTYDWNWVHWTQAHSRNHRVGQTHPVTYYTLASPGTLDTKVLKRLETKGDMAARFQDLSEIRDMIKGDL